MHRFTAWQKLLHEILVLADTLPADGQVDDAILHITKENASPYDLPEFYVLTEACLPRIQELHALRASWQEYNISPHITGNIYPVNGKNWMLLMIPVYSRGDDTLKSEIAFQASFAEVHFARP